MNLSDTLSHDEAIRLECLDLVVSSLSKQGALRVSPEGIILQASKFEKYIKEGSDEVSDGSKRDPDQARR